MEELYEFDVMWPEYQNLSSATGSGNFSDMCQSFKPPNSSSASAPVSIPAARRPCRGERIDDEAADEELVPPHVLVSRSRSVEKVASSVCSGQGRTLKGRDLKHVRDSVLRMTGFLEG